ncbi:dihydrofolate reductase family protein [Dactylosporangium sp. McL0621]|uniref:dihydrofolate reductase family protein n=1 Tax=Dactylosporangium sp. McL0621 TaxID=3415678 RepID=UPI003CF939FA
MSARPSGPARPYLVATVLTSLDGQVDEPMRFAGPYFDADAQDEAAQILDDCVGVLFGRRTYDAFAGAWSGASGAFADRINALPKYVVSATLDRTQWSNSHLLSGDAAGAVAALKQRSAGGLAVYGLGRLTRTLLTHGLVDRVRFNVHPVLAGGPPADAGLPLEAFALQAVRARASGVVVLDYTARSGSDRPVGVRPQDRP